MPVFVNDEIGGKKIKWLPRDVHKWDNFLHLTLKWLGTLLQASGWFGLFNNYDHIVPNIVIPFIYPWL